MCTITNPPFKEVGAGTHPLGEGVGQGAQVQVQPRHQPIDQAHVTGTIGKVVHGPIYARGAANHSLSPTVPMENSKFNYASPAMKVNDTSLSNITKPYECCDKGN